MVGLGNPGERYARTRHNVGFRVVDVLAGRLGIELRRRLFRSYALGKGKHEGRPLALLKPFTFMNDSGRTLRDAFRETGCGPADMLVVCDSLDLAPGLLRFRPSGSTGGHKGLESIRRHLGTDEFMRISVGIGRPAHKGQVVAYVLEEPPRGELPLLEEAEGRAAEAVLLLLAKGPDQVMNEYNRRQPVG